MDGEMVPLPCGHTIPAVLPSVVDAAPAGYNVMELIGIDAKHWALFSGPSREGRYLLESMKLGHWQGVWKGDHWDVLEEAGHQMFDETWDLVIERSAVLKSEKENKS